MKGVLAIALLVSACQFGGSQAGGVPLPVDAALPDTAPPPGYEVVSLSFRDGDGYDGTRDTWLIEQVAEPLGANAVINCDLEHTEDCGFLCTDNLGESVALIQFDVFGDGDGQVPPGAEIARALLTVSILDGSPDGADLFDVAVDWDETTTWATLGAEPGVQPDDLAPDTAVALPTDAAGAEVLDVTGTARRWSAGAAPRGWLIRARGADGIDIASRESPEEAARPSLSVAYLREIDEE
jgi:hypothetical protein